MMKLWAISTNAFLQTIRQPIYSILLLVAFAALVLTVPLTGYSMDTDVAEGDVKLLVDFGLSTVMLAGLAIAAFSAASVLTQEIEQKTVLTVVTKPIPRPLILAGKFLGVAAAVTIAVYLMSVVFLLTVRHGVVSTASTPIDWVVIILGVGAMTLTLGSAVFCNYFFGWQATSAAVAAGMILLTVAGAAVGFLDHQWQPIPFGEGVNSQIVVVLVLIWMAVMILTALAISVSTRLSQMATLGVCGGVYVLGVVSEALFRPLADENVLARLAYWASPNIAYFLNLDALTMNQTLTGRYVALAAGYAAAYSLALLALGVALFQTREMDHRTSGSSAPTLVNLYAWCVRIAAMAALLVGLSILTRAALRDGLIVGAAVTAAGPVLWLFSRALGRGRGWALILLWLVGLAQFVSSVVYLLILHPEAVNPLARIAIVGGSGLQVLYIVAMSVRRSTRDHFGWLRRP